MEMTVLNKSRFSYCIFRKHGFSLVEAIMSFAITLIIASGLAFVFRSHITQWFRGDLQARHNVAFALLNKSLYMDVKRAGPPLDVDDQGNLNISGEVAGMPVYNTVTIRDRIDDSSGKILEMIHYSLKPYSEESVIRYESGEEEENVLYRFVDGEKEKSFSNVKEISFSSPSELKDRVKVKGKLYFPSDEARKIEERFEDFTMEIRLIGEWTRVNVED